MFALLLVVFNRINLADFASHAKISNFAETHFVDEDVLQFDVSVNVSHGVVHVVETSDDLPEHGANVIVGKGRATVALEDVEQGASRAVLGDEVIGVGGMIGFEERKDVFVMK